MLFEIFGYHLGSSSWITYTDGSPVQYLSYLPFGETSINHRRTDWSARYTFSGKEKDEETGFHYFGARYYDSDLSIWLSVDPMAGARPWSTPYAYCQNNPIGRVDPDGMLDDGYTIDDMGYVKRVNNEGRRKYDVLYAKSKYNSGTIKDYDGSGTKSGIRIEKGEIKNIERIPVTVRDSGGDKIRSKTYDKYEITSVDKADNIMKFLDKNVIVEFGNTQAIKANGEEINIIYTSHDKGTVHNSNTSYLNKYLGKGHTIIRDDHIHPNGNSYLPSGSPQLRTGKSGDVPRANDILKYSPNAEFRILNNGQYYPYNKYLTK